MMEKALDRDFITANRIFWQGFKEPPADDFVLVETSEHPVINHSNAVTAKMIAGAKNLRIAWIGNKATNRELMRSYSADSIFIKLTQFSVFVKIGLLLMSVYYYFIYVLLINKLRSFKHKGISYGDFIYDGYLAVYSMATLHKLDPRTIFIFYKLLLRDEQARLLLKDVSIKAFLTANYFILSMGPVFRVALQKGIPCYVKTGGHKIITLSLFTDLSQIYNYPLKPSKDEIDNLSENFRDMVEDDFRHFISGIGGEQYSCFSVAYGNVINSNMSRESFLNEMGLEDRTNCFVMLHAFNDYPTSHFDKLLFKDYCEWFRETFRFALKDNTKNWIFKEHPANEFYATNDLNLGKIFKLLPGHVKYLSAKSHIKASVVLNVADFIITCIGTAGVEMPALNGIPSVIAGNTFFNGFGFTIEPTSKEAYFKVLSGLDKRAGRLDAEQRLRAKACYLYINKYYKVPFTAGPAITYEEASKNLQRLKDSYLGRVSEVYSQKRDVIYKEFDDYVSELRKNSFARLVKKPDIYERVMS